MIEGGCFCGEVRYQLEDGDYRAGHCHCTMCRRISGAAFVTWLIAPISSFKHTGAEPTRLQSSEHGKRYFCGNCGTPVVCINDTHPDDVDITVGSLDDPESVNPDFEFYTDTRLSWVRTNIDHP